MPSKVQWSSEREALIYQVGRSSVDRPAYPGADDDFLAIDRHVRLERFDSARLDGVFRAVAVDSPLFAEGSVTHVNAVEGWAIDLPEDWRFESASVTMLYSFALGALEDGPVPADEAKIDFHEVDGFSGSFDELIAHVNRQADPADSGEILSEERRILPGGLPALRREIASSFGGPVHLLLFVLGDRGFQAAGFGDGEAFDAVMQTLRQLH